MKKAILIIAIALVAFAATSQDSLYVIDSKLPDNIAREKVGISRDALNRMQRVYQTRMQAEDRLYDTIYNKPVIDTYMGNLWNVHYQLKDWYSVPDTILILKYNGKYYEKGDTTSTDLITERQNLVVKYNRLHETYGELVTYQKDFQKIKTRYEQLQDWEKQITE